MSIYKIALLVLICVYHLFSYEIKSYISKNKYYFNEIVDLHIEAYWGSDEDLEVNFPVDQGFHNFNITGSEQYSKNFFTNNAIVNVKVFTYRLKAKETGELYIPSVNIQLVSSGKEKYFTTTKIKLTILPSREKKPWMKVLIIMILACISAVGISLLLRSLKRSVREKKTLSRHEVLFKYLQQIKEENNLKFKKEKNEYLIFLVRLYLQAVKELRAYKLDAEPLLSLYYELKKIESKLKYSGYFSDESGSKYIKLIENTIEKECAHE
ncbi:BatD family protein [Spirochaetota bacterium]